MRSLQSQLQDIADWCHGVVLEPRPTPDLFKEGPLRAAWCAVEPYSPLSDNPARDEECLKALRGALAGFNEDGQRLYGRIRRCLTWDVEHPFRSLAELGPELPPIDWLWPQWLCRGTVTLAAAKPGMGKSLIALDVAGRLMTGTAWPDGQSNDFPPAPVVYVDGESIPQVHNERAAAWGLPRELLYLLLPQDPDVLVDLNTFKYQELLIQMVFRLRPSLVIVDSLGAVLGKGENAVEDVREVLGFLASLAQQEKTAVLVIHHLRKGLAGQGGADSVDLDSIRGSGHIGAMSRVAWGLAPVQTGPKPDKNGPRRLEVIKSNLAKKPEPLGVVLEPLAGGEHVRVVYGSAPVGYERPPERTPAQEWMLRYLEEAGKPVPTSAVLTAGLAAGFSRTTVFHARRSLEGEVVNTSSRRFTGNCWQLARPQAAEYGEFAEFAEFGEPGLTRNSETPPNSPDTANSPYSANSANSD